MILFPDTSHETVLQPEGAVFLTDFSSLVIADVHLGKSATFRAHGLPVPEGDTARDLSRMRELASRLKADEIIIAGDLFHAAAGVSTELSYMLSSFITEIGIPIHLVTGNHDAKIRTLPCGMKSHPFIDRGNIRIVHDPADAGKGPSLHLAGHWHPVARIRDGKRTSLRLPSFVLRGNLLVLPAFGSFTGGAVLHPESGDRLFVPMRDQVIEVPEELL
jgi:uncharacterized protein